MAGDLDFDIANDLRKIDGAVTRLVNEEALWAGFLQNPSKVMSEMGWHPETTEQIHDRMNKFMYAAMTNKELINLLNERYKQFTPERIEEYQSYFLDGLQHGLLKNTIDYDYDAMKHFVSDREFVTKCYLLVLRDLNDKNLFLKKYTDADIVAFTESSVDALMQGKSLADHPVLESYDDNYKVGAAYGFGPVEFDLAVTVVAPVEFAAAVTVAFQAPGAQRLLTARTFGPADQTLLTLDRLTGLYQRLVQQAEDHRF